MDKNHKALELDKILQLLAEECSSQDAARLAGEIVPVTTAAQAEYLLRETDAAYVLMAKYGAPSFRGLKDIANPLRRAQAGGGLGMRELLDVAQTLRALRALVSWHERGAGAKTALTPRFTVLSPNKYLEEKIFSSILSEEVMADSASPALSNIRRKMRNAAARVRDQLDKLIRSQAHKSHLQEAIITQRGGRFVVPVKLEHRADVPGLVHDTSASGQTLFIEPMAVVEANNEIRMLENEEREEINRILMELSAEAGSFADGIIDSYHYAVELDLIFAKAQLAYRMKAVVPAVDERGRVSLKAARHPLIAKDKVVPTDVGLGESFDALIITGPNTGGKTVALKTLGLLCLMAACGLMIPAGEGSRVAVFKHVLADIGDEQSIEQSLSTFSAHMTNIIQILSLAGEDSLVLVDELGAGTDPVEGAALATAIIEELRSKGAKLACTTHYAELKAYAIQTPGVENGCCEFDVATLRPTYRLLIGVPGRSNAFAISRRLGMEERIVQRAGELVSRENSQFEEVVGTLEESRRALEDELSASKASAEEARRSAQKAEEARQRAQEAVQKEIEAAKREAALIVQKTRQRADALLNELEDLRRQRNKELSAQQRSRIRSGMRELELEADPVLESSRADEDYVLPRPLAVGDDVLLADIGKSAVVLELPKDGMVLVQAGIIKTRVPVENLRLQEKKKKARPAGRTVTKDVSTDISSSLDLRGKMSDEAIMELDNFLDRLSRSGIQQATIIHGKGTGALRTAVQQHLRHHKLVRRFRLGSYGEGESGVTIVELK